MKVAFLLLFICFMLVPCTPSRAQRRQREEEPRDSIVRLLHADTLQMQTISGRDYRMVYGKPASFFHNNAYLYCERAVWDVSAQTITAERNVRITQNGVTITSDRLIYRVDENVAEFRGAVVELSDDKNNILRTSCLDYNTKDSVAVFRGGGSLKDKDGNIIESADGKFESQTNQFLFENMVNLYTDSVFVKGNRLFYQADSAKATFYPNTYIWQSDNFLTCNDGWYDSDNAIFFFTDRVYGYSKDQQGWCDSMYVWRNQNNIEMLGRVQVSDSSRNVTALAGRMLYVDSLSALTMLRTPAIVGIGEPQGPRHRPDSVFVGADSIVFHDYYRFEVDSVEVLDALERKKSLNVDPIAEFRLQAIKAAAEAKAKAAMEDPNSAAAAAKRAAEYKKLQEQQAASIDSTVVQKNLFEKISAKIKERRKAKAKQKFVPTAADSAAMRAYADSLGKVIRDSLAKVAADSILKHREDSIHLADSLFKLHQLDSLARIDSLARADSIAKIKAIPDSSRVIFIDAVKNVKIWRANMQVRCDSMRYSGLDSLARLYNSPYIWNEVKHEYLADSIYAVIDNGRMQRAHLLSNAFIHIQENPTYYDQVRSTEMTAYFGEDSKLTRFDGLGGSTLLFFIEENDTIATSNRKECKMLSALFADGTIRKVYYFDQVKSDAYPVAQMRRDELYIKGFNWKPELRPVDRREITTQVVRPGCKDYYRTILQPSYIFTSKYFPGYIENIREEIRLRSIEKKQNELERKRKERRRKNEEAAAAASAAAAGTAAAAGAEVSASAAQNAENQAQSSTSSSSASSSSVKDTTSVVDTATVAIDSSVVEAPDTVLTAEQKRALKQKEREEAKAQKQKELEAKWAEQDAREEAKAKAKEQKKLDKEREKKLKMLRREAAQEEKERQRREKYIDKMSRRFRSAPPASIP